MKDENSTSRLLLKVSIIANDIVMAILSRIQHIIFLRRDLSYFQVSDASSALEYANANSFSPLDPSHANFLIVAAEDAPENVDRELIERLRSRGIKVGIKSDSAG